MRTTGLLCTLLALVACDPEPAETDDVAWYETPVEVTTLWGLELDVGGRSEVGVTADGRAFFGSPDGVLFIEASPGGQPVRYGPYEGLDHELFTPVVAEGVALLRNVRGDLLAVGFEADEVLWQTVDHMPVIAHDEHTTVAVMRRNTTDPAVIGRELRSGELLWTVEDDALVVEPQDSEGGLVCGAREDTVVVVDATGEVRWSAEHGLGDLGGPSVLRCALHEARVVVMGVTGDSATEVVLFDTDGSELQRARWPFSGGATEFVVREDGVIIVWSSGQMVLYSADLDEVERHDDRAPLGVDPASGSMYLQTDGGAVLTGSDFTPRWRGGVGRPTFDYRFLGVTVVDDRVYWADAQDGVLGGDRWSRYLGLGLAP